MTTATDGGTRRRAPLSRDRVLRAAVDLADSEGIEALSMRRVALALGVEAMSLYRHVANKEDLLDGVVDVVVDEIEPPVAGVEWRTALRERILSARRMLMHHPWACDVIVSRATMTSTMMRYMESMGAILRGGGFSIDLTHHALHVLGSRILGFAQELYDDSAALATSPAVSAMMLEQMAGDFPVMAEIATHIVHAGDLIGAGCDTQSEFELGLDVIIDGLERLRSTA